MTGTGDGREACGVSVGGGVGSVIILGVILRVAFMVGKAVISREGVGIVAMTVSCGINEERERPYTAVWSTITIRDPSLVTATE